MGPTGTQRAWGPWGGAASDEAGIAGGSRAVGRQPRGGARARPSPAGAQHRGLIGDVATVTTGLGLANPASLFTNLTGGVLRTRHPGGARAWPARPGNPLDAFADLAGMGAALSGRSPRFFREVGQGPAPAGQRLVGQRVGGRDLTRSQHPLALAATIGTRVNAATDEVIGALNEAGARAVAARRGENPERRREEGAGVRHLPQRALLPHRRPHLQGGSWTGRPHQAAPATRLPGRACCYTFAPYVRMPERLLVESVAR